jgi:iron(III) transport system permease protein
MHLFGFFSLEQVFTLKHWHAVLNDAVFTASLVNTLVLAAGTAAFAVVVSLLLAYLIARTEFWGRHILDFLSWVPFTMPGILFSLAVLWLVLEIPMLRPLYGTTILLILTVGLGTLTVGTQIIKSNLMQLGGDLERASWISGASWGYTFMRIVVALSIRAIIVVGIVGFIAAARNISHLALLSSSDNRPLALLQLQYLIEGRYEAASVVGFIVVVVTVGVAFLARTYGFRLGASHTG